MTPITGAQITEWERQVHGENANYVTVTLAPILIDALRVELAEVERLNRLVRTLGKAVPVHPSDPFVVQSGDRVNL